MKTPSTQSASLPIACTSEALLLPGAAASRKIQCPDHTVHIVLIPFNLSSLKAYCHLYVFFPFHGRQPGDLDPGVHIPRRARPGTSRQF